MLRYNSRHISSINMSIFRRTNCIITASGYREWRYPTLR